MAIAAVDREYVYWFRTGSSVALRAAGRCRGEPTTIQCGAADCAPAWRAVAATGTRAGEHVYFVDREGSIIGVHREDGQVVRVAEKAMPLALAVSAEHLLWVAETTGFHAVPVDDDGAPPMALGPPGFAALGQPRAFVADDTFIYWLASSDGSLPPAIYQMRHGGAAVLMVPGGARLGAPAGALALDGSDLYFTGWGGEIAAVPRAGGAVRTVASYQNPGDLAVTAQHVYWSAAGESPSLRRVGKTGGQAQAPAGGPGGASSPIADPAPGVGDSVWVDDGKDLFRVGE